MEVEVPKSTRLPKTKLKFRINQYRKITLGMPTPEIQLLCVHFPYWEYRTIAYNRIRIKDGGNGNSHLQFRCREREREREERVETFE